MGKLGRAAGECKERDRRKRLLIADLGLLIFRFGARGARSDSTAVERPPVTAEEEEEDGGWASLIS